MDDIGPERAEDSGIKKTRRARSGLLWLAAAAGGFGFGWLYAVTIGCQSN